jgi:WD40 repeat protein
MNRRFLRVTALVILHLLPGLSSALELRQIDSISLGTGIQVYGQSTGSLVLLGKSELTLLDNNRRTQSRIDFDSSQVPVVSSNGLFYGIVEGFTPGKGDSSVNVVTVFDHLQSPLWGDYNLIDGEYYLSPSGEYLVAVGDTKDRPNSRLFLYHRDNPTIAHDIMFFEDILFSDDGRYFLIDSGLEGIRLFSADGTPIRTFGTHRAYAFSENGDWLALYNGGILRLFKNSKEQLNLNLKKSPPIRMTIRERAGCIILVFSRELMVLNLNDGSILSQLSPDKKEESFVSADVSPDGDFIVCAAKVGLTAQAEKPKGGRSCSLYAYHIDGRGVGSMELSSRDCSSDFPIVMFGSDNKTIAVETEKGLRFIQMH